MYKFLFSLSGKGSTKSTAIICVRYPAEIVPSGALDAGELDFLVAHDAQVEHHSWTSL